MYSIFELVLCVLVSGIACFMIGYSVKDAQVREFIKKIDKNMEELQYLADLIREEKEDDN